MTRTGDFTSFAYVANSGTQDISVLGLRPDGDLVALASVAVQRPIHTGRSMVLAPSPDHGRLYAAYLSGPDQAMVAAFAIDAETGNLRRIGATPLAAPSAYLSTDRSGRFLFSASYAGNLVTVNAIGADGAVWEALQVIPTAPMAHCIIADRSNRFVLHTSLGGDLIYQRRFDPQSGRLSPNEPPVVSARAKAGPRFIVFAPHADFAYVINELDGAVDVHRFAATTGTLDPALQTISALPDPFTGKPWCADIHIRPDGRFLYVSERTSSVITAFAVDRASGRLSRIACHETVRQPRTFAIDPAGSWLLAAGQLADRVVCHAIDARSGGLTARREYPVGKNPTWIEVLAPA
ncbi:MAG: lactonase family protein [Gammaproteobacteria bacterium]|nr:lactonase family protein [Gammaproteobacteria bacterium]